MKKILSFIVCCLFVTAANASVIEFRSVKHQNDSLLLAIYDLNVPSSAFRQFVTGRFDNGTFRYLLPVTGYPQYISFQVNGKPVITNALVEPTDSICITIMESGKYAVTGRGKEKWSCRKLLDSLIFNQDFGRKMRNKDDPGDSVSWLETLHSAKALLQRPGQNISAMAYTSLLTGRISFLASERLATLPAILAKDSLKHASWVKTELNSMESCIQEIISTQYDSLLSLCFEFPELLVKKMQVDKYTSMFKRWDLDQMFVSLSEKYTGVLESRVLFGLLIVNRKSETFLPLARKQLPYIADPRQLRVLFKMVEEENPGTQLSAASFKDGNNKSIQLNEFRDSVILLDFWYTGCHACIKMQESLAPLEEKLKDKAFRIVSVSIDRDLNLWKKSVASGNYTNSRHVNLRTGSEGDDHPFIKQFQISSYPTLMLIDKSGKLITTGVPDPRFGKLNELIRLINANL
jgi:thiol-disulfide isomerase/thioredoxin